MTAPPLSLEAMFTSPLVAGIDASPLQRAICRASQGEPIGDVLTTAEIERYFGTDTIPPVKPQIVDLTCGVRSGKSFLSSVAALHGAHTLPLGTLKAHEIPRYAIVGPTVDAARATFTILRGIVESSPLLRETIDGEIGADSLVIRRPHDGRRVEVCVVAAARGGASVRNRWLLGFVLEEVAQIGAEATGAVVSAEEILRAAVTRLLPGAQGWVISSPFGPTGLLYDLFRRHFGKPGRVLVVHAPTRAMNPSFPQATIDAIAADDPDAAAREYGAEWVDADSAFLAATLLETATRSRPLVAVPPAGSGIVLAGDFATRGNAWTLVAAAAEQSRAIVLGAWEWIGSKSAPLSPRAVFADMAVALQVFGTTRYCPILCDGWSFDAMRDHAQAVGLDLQQAERGDVESGYQRIKALLGAGDLEIPPLPQLRADLQALRLRAGSGSIRVELPRTSNGRHCDFAPAVSLAVLGAVNGAGESMWGSDELRDAAAAATASFTSRYDTRGVFDDLYPNRGGGRGLW